MLALAPLRISVPAPALVRPNVLPPIAPPTVRLPPFTVTVRLALIVTAPVPRFRSLVPVKVKLPFQCCALLLLRVMAPPLVLSIVPPATVKVPVPGAAALLRLSVPPFSVRPPLKVFAPESVSTPVPAMVKLRLPPDSPTTPPNVRGAVVGLTVALPVSVVAPKESA